MRKKPGWLVFLLVTLVVGLFLTSRIFEKVKSPVAIEEIMGKIAQLGEQPAGTPGARSVASGAQEIRKVIQQCAPQISPDTIEKIIFVESSWEPFAINVNRQRLERQPRNKTEAVVTAKHYIGQGYSVDMGYMQINSGHLSARRWSVEDLFDTCKNINAGQQILVECYNKAVADRIPSAQLWQASMSCYHRGNFTEGVQNGYAAKVYKAPVTQP